jgi:transcriptional regulator
MVAAMLGRASGDQDVGSFRTVLDAFETPRVGNLTRHRGAAPGGIFCRTATAMYLPALNDERDRGRLVELIEAHPFATLVTPTAAQLWISHVPLSVRREGDEIVLHGHVARVNEHWRAFDGASRTTAIFHGPHAYVSPTWYAAGPAVPTWNYAVVHVTGNVRVRDDAGTSEALVRDLTARFEDAPPNGWSLDDVPDDLRHELVAAIVSFELRAETVEGKLKLGQNRSAADRAGVVAALEASGGDLARALAEMMRAVPERK